MNGKANSFPLNFWGLGLGLTAASAIALSGKFTSLLWGLPENLALVLKITGWALAALLYIWLFLKVKAGFEISFKRVLLVSGILAAPFLLTLSVFAGDIFAYVANVKVAALGNPYVLTPNTLGNDTILQLVDPAWQAWPSAYGPLWQLLAKGIGFLTLKADLIIFIYKIFGLLAVLLTAAVIAKKSGPSLAALFAWSPIVLVEAVADAHNDVFIGLALVLAIYWLAKPIKSAVAVALGIILKYIPILVLPGLLLNFKNFNPNFRVWKYLWVIFFILLISFAPFWFGPETFRGLSQQNGLFYPPIFFPQSILFYGSYLFGGTAQNPEIFARVTGWVIFAGIFLYLLRRIKNQRLEIAHATLFILATYLFFASSYVQAWYLLWLWPMALILPKKPALRWVGIIPIFWACLVFFENLFI
ncbi:hypothetical protein C4546_01815 [Candidatus Parcubacteria bacterium]|jgi:alpha-1,6-mannosyltransferase|nr:MAG: hypothetical protein C4546_01815 [Candidatus Parcubacteria bacterium]